MEFIFASIIASVQSKPVSNGLDFAVEVDDRNDFYLGLLNLEMSKKGMRPNAVLSRQYGDVITFTTKNNGRDIDVTYYDRVEFDEVPREIPMFSLTRQWASIKKAFDKLTSASKPSVSIDRCPNCGFPVGLAKKVTVAPQFIINDGERISVSQKVSIFSKHVKIGYNVYEIYVDLFSGNRFVIIDGNRYYVNETFCGRKYLQLA